MHRHTAVYYLPPPPRPKGERAHRPAPEPVRPAQLDRLRKLACLMQWTSSRLDGWIKHKTEGKCLGLAHIKTAKGAEILGEWLDFYYVTRTEDYLARQRAAGRTGR